MTMSEKQQGNTSAMCQKMLHRYGDGHHHKHDKNHVLYRQHAKSHPTTSIEEEKQGSTGLLRIIKLRKMRKRLDKGRIH